MNVNNNLRMISNGRKTLDKMIQFNKNAPQYDVRKKISYPENIYNNLSSLCLKHDYALDIGCGNGVSASRLSKYFKNVEGIDLGDNLINIAKKMYPDIKFSVSTAENYIRRVIKYDLITCATAFYWMDRKIVLNNIERNLNKDGVFCAYKYDFPVIYGPLRDIINFELATKWQKCRDSRLIEYDDTLEVLNESKIFNHVQEFMEPNVIELSSEEVAQFFLSTSYVTKYIEQSGDTDYSDYLIKKCMQSPQLIKVRFDIHGFIGQGLKIKASL